LDAVLCIVSNRLGLSRWNPAAILVPTLQYYPETSLSYPRYGRHPLRACLVHRRRERPVRACTTPPPPEQILSTSGGDPLPRSVETLSPWDTYVRYDRCGMMARHYPQQGPPLAGHPVSPFMFHDSEQMLMDSRIHLPPDHLSNCAFWYRPDTSLPVAERQEVVHLAHAGIPGVEAVKHRRTRSGCFTCRSRRVKVRRPVNHPS
jgi:hypothetical protein